MFSGSVVVLGDDVKTGISKPFHTDHKASQENVLTGNLIVGCFLFFS